MKAKKIYTHQDIARMVGVSQPTVSRALDPAQRHLISNQVVEKILRVAQRIDFKSNVLARRLRNQRSETVTLVIPGEVFQLPQNLDFESGNSPLMWDEVKGVMHEAHARGYDVKLVPQYNLDPALRDYFTEHAGYPHSDGVIFSGLGTVEGAALALQRRSIPCVATGAYPSALSVPLIAIDQGPGIEQALTALLADGHRRIAFFAFSPDFKTGDCWLPRYRAFTSILKRADALDPALIYCTPSEARMRQTLRELLPTLPFTAAFCTNDIMADRLVRELAYLDKQVPRDVAVVGFDNNPLYRRGDHALSTVELPLYALGRSAVSRLIGMIESQQKPQGLELIPTSFLARKTT